MSKQTEALKLALEALENLPEMCGIEEAITALREALASEAKEQPAPATELREQEPVVLPCCGFTDARAVRWNFYNKVVQCHNCGQVYTSPPAQRKPLTDEQVRKIAKQYALGLAFPYDSQTTPEMFARAIEAAHGIKENT